MPDTSNPTLNHIGICVRDLERAIAVYRDGLGLALERIEDLPDRGVRVAFLRLGESHVELISPAREDSEVSAFLAKRGEGLHHIALDVVSVDTAVNQARAAGAAVIPGSVKPGAGGHLVAFLHPGNTAGVLVELVETRL